MYATTLSQVHHGSHENHFTPLNPIMAEIRFVEAAHPANSSKLLHNYGPLTQLRRGGKMHGVTTARTYFATPDRARGPSLCQQCHVHPGDGHSLTDSFPSTYQIRTEDRINTDRIYNRYDKHHNRGNWWSVHRAKYTEPLS